MQALACRGHCFLLRKSSLFLIYFLIYSMWVPGGHCFRGATILREIPLAGFYLLSSRIEVAVFCTNQEAELLKQL